MDSMNTNALMIGVKKEGDALKPIQHPIKINDSDANIVSYKVPPRNLTPYYQIPNQALAPLHFKSVESPMGSRQLDICLLGAANAGKSSIFNWIAQRNISAVSNKYNTTDEAVSAYYTDVNTKTQLHLMDTPGVTKASSSLRSNLLISKAWGMLEDADMSMFVVDSVKKLDFETRESILRLRKLVNDPQDQKIIESMKNDTFSEDKMEKGFYDMSEEEQKLSSWNLPSILVLNKIDLVNNKVKLRNLQNELEDIGDFEKIFHVSAQTGFGMDALKEYLLHKAKPRNWEVHPSLKSKQTEVEKAEESMKQAIFEKFFKELPYQIGIKCVGWVPKLNGELRVDINLDVKNKVQIGMLLGEKARILRDVRERATQILEEKIQRPVTLRVEISKRRHEVNVQNSYDSYQRTVGGGPP